MYIEIASRPQPFSCESLFAKVKRIVKRTIADLSNLSIDQAQAIRRILKGEKQAQRKKYLAKFGMAEGQKSFGFF